MIVQQSDNKLTNNRNIHHIVTISVAFCIIIIIEGEQRRFADGTGPIFVKTLTCDNTVDLFRGCVVENDLGLSKCHHSEEVGVHCEGKLQR